MLSIPSYPNFYMHRSYEGINLSQKIFISSYESAPSPFNLRGTSACSLHSNTIFESGTVTIIAASNNYSHYLYSYSLSFTYSMPGLFFIIIFYSSESLCLNPNIHPSTITKSIGPSIFLYLDRSSLSPFPLFKLLLY